MLGSMEDTFSAIWIVRNDGKSVSNIACSPSTLKDNPFRFHEALSLEGHTLKRRQISV